MTYQLLSRYYDLENADFTEDLDFWLELAEETGGPVLEVGCGTGRVLLHLARRHHAVTGLDNSPEMLARLQARLQAAGPGHTVIPPVIVQADMLDFDLAGTFKLALLPFNTFAHLLTLEDQLRALQRIRVHLPPGGRLVLDLPNPGEAYAAQEQGLTLERSFMDGERVVQQFSTIVVDRAAQLAHIQWMYDSVGPQGDVQRLLVPLTLRYTFPGEIRLLLERAGFRLAHLYGDYDRSPLADGSPRMIVSAAAGG